MTELKHDLPTCKFVPIVLEKLHSCRSVRAIFRVQLVRFSMSMRRGLLRKFFPHAGYKAKCISATELDHYLFTQ